MNLKPFAVLSALAVASSAATTNAFQAASSDGSISAEEAAIPPCNQTELVLVAELMTKNNRKKQCEATLGVSELVKASDKKTMCSLTSCVVALESLYVTLPDCKYLDWGIRYNVKRLLQFCTIDPEKISTDPAEYKDIKAGTGSSAGSDTPEATVDWTDSSSDAVSFAPIGGSVTPTPTPVTTAAQQVTPATETPKSAAGSSVAVASSAAAVVAAVVASLTL